MGQITRTRGHDGKDYEIYMPGVKISKAGAMAGSGLPMGTAGLVRSRQLYRLDTGGRRGVSGIRLRRVTEQWHEGFKTMEIGKAHAGKTFVDWW